MKLIVGLGNPGKEYQNTPHNAGFMALDQLADSLSLPNWQDKFKGELIKDNLGGKGFVLLKPQTFMNLSGDSVQACLAFYKFELEDILVVSDDLDLNFGQLRFRKKGGHGGHNGLRDLITKLGGAEFNRLRIGIGRPEGKQSVTSHVLGNVSGDQKIELSSSIDRAVGHIKEFISGQPVEIKNLDQNK